MARQRLLLTLIVVLFAGCAGEAQMGDEDGANDDASIGGNGAEGPGDNNGNANGQTDPTGATGSAGNGSAGVTNTGGTSAGDNTGSTGNANSNGSTGSGSNTTGGTTGDANTTGGSTGSNTTGGTGGSNTTGGTTGGNPIGPNAASLRVRSAASFTPIPFATQVLAHNADGTIRETQTTDSNGTVVFDPAPAMITVLRVQAGGDSLSQQLLAVTYLGVAAGDALEIDLRQDTGLFVENGSYSVTGPDQNAGDLRFEVNGGRCSASALDMSDPVTIGAENDGCTFADNALLASAFSDNLLVAYAHNKSFAPPDNNATQAVTLSAWAAPTNVIVTPLNAGASAVGSAQLSMVVRDFAFDAFTDSLFLPSAATFPVAAGFADALELTAELYVNQNATLTQHRRLAASTTAHSVDFGSSLPRVDAPSLNVSSTPRPTITLNTAGAMTQADGAYVSLSVRSEAMGDSRTYYDWVFVVPKDTTTFAVPSLPTSAVNFEPVMSSEVTDVAFVDFDNITDFKDLRALPLRPSAITFGATGARGFAVGQVHIRLGSQSQSVQVSSFGPSRI